MIRRQSNNQWSGGIAAHPAQKISSSKIRSKNSRFDIFGLTRHPPHWLSSNWPNSQRGILLISVGAIEGHFEGKTPMECNQRCLVLARQCPGSPCICNPEETGLPVFPVSWSPTIFSGSGTIGLPPAFWIEKTIQRSPFFFRRVCRYCCGDMVGRTNFWFFFSGLQKLEQRTKKCIELRGGVCWINLEFGICSLFLSWSV